MPGNEQQPAQPAEQQPAETPAQAPEPAEPMEEGAQAPAPSEAQDASKPAKPWGQCGGDATWAGPTTCVEGTTCVQLSSTFSQARALLQTQRLRTRFATLALAAILRTPAAPPRQLRPCTNRS